MIRGGKKSAGAGLALAKGAMVAGAVLIGTALATAPVIAESYTPQTSPGVKPTQNDPKVFKADPVYEDKPYDAEGQIFIYGGKKAVDTPPPLLELGRPMYREGPLGTGETAVGSKNLIYPGFTVFGDWRNAISFADNGKKEVASIATRLNLEADLRLTSTERLHALFRPFDRQGDAMRYEFAGNDGKGEGFNRINFRPVTAFFEGDLGQIAAGLTGTYNKVDLPFTFGLIPMILQNGVWLEDAFYGAAFSLPAKNNRTLGISNMDVTFFAGFDKVTTIALKNADGSIADHNANIFGVAGFVEANEGYWEGGFGRVDGKSKFSDLSYNSLTLSHSRRFRDIFSTSLRGIWTFGQEPDNNRRKTADGFALLWENSFITAQPEVFVPYFNSWVGFDKPVPLARAEGGLLKNTGILFETDGLTGFPKLDDTGQGTYGGAIGLQYLFNLEQQIVVEAATVQILDRNNLPGRPAKGPEYGIGARYQIPLTNAWIFRADVMYGWFDQDKNVSGARVELRRKF